MKLFRNRVRLLLILSAARLPAATGFAFFCPCFLLFEQKGREGTFELVNGYLFPNVGLPLAATQRRTRTTVGATLILSMVHRGSQPVDW